MHVCMSISDSDSQCEQGILNMSVPPTPRKINQNKIP